MSAKPIVLVIEGSPSEGDTLAHVLDSQQYHTVFVESPEDSLAHIESPIDLVLSGISVNATYGRELLERWRKRRPEIPYVLLVDADSIDSAQSAVEMGATGYILCPIHRDEARDQIAKWLSRNEHTHDQQESHAHANEHDNLSDTPRFSEPAIRIPPGTTLEDLERVAVEQALRQHQGNRTHAAKELGIPVRTLQRKLKAWGEARNKLDQAPEMRNPGDNKWNSPTGKKEALYRPRFAKV